MTILEILRDFRVTLYTQQKSMDRNGTNDITTQSPESTLFTPLVNVLSSYSDRVCYSFSLITNSWDKALKTIREGCKRNIIAKYSAIKDERTFAQRYKKTFVDSLLVHDESLYDITSLIQQALDNGDGRDPNAGHHCFTRQETFQVEEINIRTLVGGEVWDGQEVISGPDGIRERKTRRNQEAASSDSTRCTSHAVLEQPAVNCLASEDRALYDARTSDSPAASSIWEACGNELEGTVEEVSSVDRGLASVSYY